MKPNGFSWVEPPHLAAMARPESPEELDWLRSQGISLLISLTEEPINSTRPVFVSRRNFVAFGCPTQNGRKPTDYASSPMVNT